MAVLTLVPTFVAAEQTEIDRSQWHIKDIYNYLGAMGDDLSPQKAAKYCQFIIDCQDPNTGNFVDRHGEFIYSVKAYYTLKRFGYEPKYPLSVCEPPYRNFTCEEVSEQMSPEGFREWLDYIYNHFNAYGAGSLRGHLIHPHVMNLEKAGKAIEDSPYIPVFKQGLLENQGGNGFRRNAVIDEIASPAARLGQLQLEWGLSRW